METLEQIKTLVESLNNDASKFFTSGNKSAGTRARKTSQELKALQSHYKRPPVHPHTMRPLLTLTP